MHLRLIAVLSVMLVLSGARDVQASGDVLLPSDSKDSAPNLGLVPSERAPAATDSNPSSGSDAGNTKDATTQDTGTSAKSILPSVDSAALPFTPVPAQPALANGAFSGMPTTVISEPDTSLMAAPQQPPAPPPNLSPQEAKIYAAAMSNLKTPYSLAVGFATTSVWGPGDIAEVNNHLGIDRASVTSLCRLSLGGMLLTSKQPYAFESGLSPHANVSYDGTITNATIHIQALCNKVPLPPNKGIVIQIGDKYTVPLGSVTCPPPPYTNVLKQLIILYAGNGGGECKYQ